MENNKKKKQLNNFIKFTGIGIQMGVTIYLGSVLGEWLDSKYSNDGSFYKKVCTLAAVFMAITALIVQVNRMNKNS